MQIELSDGSIQNRPKLRMLADDFGLLDREEVQKAIKTCKDYSDGQYKIMRIYDNVYMEEKSVWDKFFDDTEDIQCISCLDAYVLEYVIDGCWVQINRHSSGKDSKFTLSIKKHDWKNRKDFYTSDFSKEWKEKNVYNQALVKKFVSGYFFY